jgi:ribulose-phosphate 3-epimerase
MKTLVVPAVIAKSQNELNTILNKITGKVKRVQLDIMDGKFVPNTSLNFDFKLPRNFEYEAHLMVKEPLKWIQKNIDKVDLITVHIETLTDIKLLINYVKNKKAKINMALIPQTELQTLTPYMEIIDGILVMTVNPGSYCIKKEFNTEALQKVRQIRKINATIPIEVDGCMNPKNVKLAKKSGANIFASGSYIFKSENIDKALNELKNAVT